MRQVQVFSGIAIASSVALLGIQPVWAAAAQVTGVRLNPKGTTLELILETQAGDKHPQVFSVNRGNDWVADIVNARLSLEEGNSFRQENPMPGIAAVVVNQLEPNSIRVTVSGADTPATGQILQQESQGITLGISTEATAQATASIPQPYPAASVSQTNSTLPTLPPQQVAQTPLAVPPPSVPRPLTESPSLPTLEAQTPTPQPVQPQQTPAPVTPVPPPEVLVPDPKITIDGVPAAPAGTVQPVAPAPPFLPRAVAPPVGDIAISNINAAVTQIDLGTAAVVPRLSLREAPVREVLALLARSAGLNLAFTGDAGASGQPGQPPGQPGAPGGAGGPTISLDIENEPVQDVFNYVLQLSGLQANRIGRTIFVGNQLPVGARNIITRTLRLNQVPVTSAANYLTAQGAETQIPIEQVQIQTVGEGAAARTIETRTPSILALRATETDATLLLRGLSVVTDDRLNAITLVGEPRQVEIATALLTQLDLRRRQVAINVKIVDVNLLGTDAFNTSFSFGIGDSFFVNDGGAAVFNYGGFRPPTSLEATSSLASPTVISNPFADADTFLDVSGGAGTSIPGTGVDTVRIFNDPTTGQFLFDRQEGNDFSFFQRVAGISADPFVAGITDFTLGTPNVITTTVTPGTPATPPVFDANGNLVSPGTAGTPATSNTTLQQGTPGTLTAALPSLFQYPKRFLAALQAQITSGNAKILTDPTLVVQEGQTARVNLTQEVVGNIRSETESSDNVTTRTVTAEIREAGLILEIIVDRVDDNGFISLAVNPRVTSIGGFQDLVVGEDENRIALLNVRQLESGRIRLRDSQTLILSGIIQESDRTTVRKVPILGDIPLLGALFRSTERQNQRQEVIVLLTPQIIDDSERSSFGYNYTPGRETQQFLERRGFSPQGR
ncbi:MAG TPA: general secretion pathway protein GspD [Cyanobacteria bacterium UBA9273]|nr:general secretion pathway protein GspD [Cyanobacteria bacterium UBA9273]